MGRGRFTEEEQKILKGSKHVILVTDKAIYYTNEFKLLFIKEYLGGKKPAQIFQDAGFDLKMLGSKRIERAAARWKESYQAGSLGTKYVFFRTSAETGAGDNLHQDKSEKQKMLVERCCEQEKQIRNLTAEIKLLRMIKDFEEVKTGYQIPTEVICRFIEVIAKEGTYSIISLCKAAGISKSTFYRRRSK